MVLIWKLNINSDIMEERHMKAMELELIKNERKESFIKGKNGIQGIIIRTDDRIIEIKYDNDSDWKYLIIPFNHFDSFRFK